MHTVSVTVADKAGNVAGPVSWQFAVADPAVLRLAARGRRRSMAGGRASVRFVATGNGTPLAGVRVVDLDAARPDRRGFRIVRTLTTGSAGAVSWSVAPMRTTAYRAALEAAPAVTATRSVAVIQRVALAVDHLRIHPGGAVRLSGLVVARPSRRAGARAAPDRARLADGGDAAARHPRRGTRRPWSPGISGRYVLRVVAPATPPTRSGAAGR